MSKWRYIPLGKSDKLDIYKQMPAKNKEILVNQTLIIMRKKINKFVEDNNKYKYRISNFNTIVRSKPLAVVTGIVNMWMKQE